MLVLNAKNDYDININVFIDDEIDKKELKIIVNPNGYLLKGYDPIKDIGETNIYIPLYKESKLQNYKNTNIKKYSDFNIYVKYKNKYAKMKYTNTLVLGQNDTTINIFIKKYRNIKYLSSSNSGFSVETILQSSFKDIDYFKDNKNDMKMFSYLNTL